MLSQHCDISDTKLDRWKYEPILSDEYEGDIEWGKWTCHFIIFMIIYDYFHIQISYFPHSCSLVVINATCS